MTAKRWQEWLSLLLGAWLLVSPWALGFTDSPAAWNAYVVGIAAAALAAVAVYKPSVWSKAVMTALGAWLIMAPWALGFTADRTAMLDSVLVGLVTAGLALWALLRDGAFDTKQHVRQAA